MSHINFLACILIIFVNEFIYEIFCDEKISCKIILTFFDETKMMNKINCFSFEVKSYVLLIVLLLIFVDNIVCQCIYELNDINYWNIISGEWETTSNGYIKVNESIQDSSILITDNNIIPDILEWNKYSMSVNMSILPAKLENTYPDGYVCVIFNAQNISSKMQYCVFQFLCHSELWEINDRIGIFDTTFNDTNSIILKVDIDGYNYTIYLNDVLVTSGVSSLYDHGSVGFYSWKSSVILKSITVNVSENICYNGSLNISVAPTTQPTTTVLSVKFCIKFLYFLL